MIMLLKVVPGVGDHVVKNLFQVLVIMWLKVDPGVGDHVVKS